MNRELEQKLVNKYPNLLRYYRKDYQLPLYYGIECGDGWYSLIDKTLGTIQEESIVHSGSDELFVIHQIKEKFGTLRIYTPNKHERIVEAVRNAYIESLKTCVMCGVQNDTITRNEHSFVRTMCSQCMIEYARNGWKLNGEF